MKVFTKHIFVIIILLRCRNNDTSYATGAHFNLPGHSTADMQMSIVELVHDKDPMVLSIREQHYIRFFNAHHKGMNRNNG